MKTLIITAGLILAYGLSYAQPKYRPSDFKLSPDVAKYELVECSYDPDLESYYVTKKQDIIFENGLARKINEQINYVFLINSSTEFQYNGTQLVSSTFKSDSQSYVDKFKYQNGKLVEIVTEGSKPKKQTFEYDAKGNLTKDFTYEGNNLISSSTYSGYIGSDTYLKKLVKFRNNEVDGTQESNYVKGNLISEKMDFPYLQDIISYKYDKYGNIISQTIFGETYTSSFVYDQKGNVIKSKVTYPGLESGDPSVNYFTFMRITFTNGKTIGSLEYDKQFIKKFESNF